MKSILFLMLSPSKDLETIVKNMKKSNVKPSKRPNLTRSRSEFHKIRNFWTHMNNENKAENARDQDWRRLLV